MGRGLCVLALGAWLGAVCGVACLGALPYGGVLRGDSLEVSALRGDSLGDSVLRGDSLLMSGAGVDDTLRLDGRILEISERLLGDSALYRPHRYENWKPDPIRAMWLGMVIPGGGQIYNRKFWKLPIFYGGIIGCAYALTWNGQMLRDYSQAYQDITDDDPTTKSYEEMLPINYKVEGREQQLAAMFKRKKDFYRKYRDLSIFSFAAVYALSVIDAYVDAELSTFDIGRDLSLQWSPGCVLSSGGDLRPEGVAPGVSVTVTY